MNSENGIYVLCSAPEATERAVNALLSAGMPRQEIVLGAILTTSVVFLLTAPLLRRNHRPYDPQVSKGKVMVGINSVPDALRNKITELLKEIGEIRQ